MTKSVVVLTVALLGAAACGPSGTVSPSVQTADAGDGRAANDLPRPADLPAAADADPGPAVPPPPDAGPADAPLAPDLALPPDAPVNPTPDAPADVRLPPDLAPDLPPPPDLPPDLPPDTVPPGPWIMVSQAPGQAATNLTMAGVLDRAHFGQGGTVSRVNRKMGAPMRITLMPVAGPALFGYNDRPVRFSWTDGTPTAQVTNTADGISHGDEVGRGFELRIQGDVTRARQVRVHWGVWGGRARLTARLSDDSVPVYTDNTLTAGDPGADRITTIQFRTSQASQTLVVRWIIEAITMEYGNVTLQAVTLTE